MQWTCCAGLDLGTSRSSRRCSEDEEGEEGEEEEKEEEEEEHEGGFMSRPEVIGEIYSIEVGARSSTPPCTWGAWQAAGSMQRRTGRSRQHTPTLRKGSWAGAGTCALTAC